MAEDNAPISSLDPLGPEFGRLNQPIVDQKGLSPFEGDRMRLPEINTPSYFPVIPSAPALDRPDQNIRDNVVGSPVRRPPISKQSTKLPSPDEFSKSLNSYMSARLSTAKPQDQYAKIYSYDASPASNTFYDRYAAYGQEKFDEIGFHPLRDNEALYNAKTTGWNDFIRMMTNSFVPLYTRGFVSGPKSLYKMLQGDFSADTEDARIYERAAAIGQSTKGGFGAFMNNTFMNFGYTAGIISEAILEEVAGAVLAPLTGGASFFAATANNARKLENVVGGLNMVRGTAQAENLSQGASAFNRTLDSFNVLDNARRFFQSAQTEKALTTGIGGFLNPLQNLTEGIYGAARNADNLTGMARVASTLGKTGGGFYRDIRNINMALAEARLEGGFVENKVYQDLYDDYYRVNGKAPENDMQHDMRVQAKKAASTAMMWNTALIYGSNKITFGNIMSPRGGIRKFLGAKTDDILNYKYGKVVYEKAAKKTAGETAEAGAKKAMKGEFKFIDKNFKNWAKGLTKDPLSKSALKTIGYFKANFAEGIQENLQEVIAQASEKYYIDSFKDPALANHLYAKAVTDAAIAEQYSAKGFETFASGFFMGMFASPLNSAIPAMSVGYNRIFNTEEYQKYKETKDYVKKTVVDTLNTLGSDPSEFFNSRLFNYATQNKVSTDLNNVDTKLKNDLKEEAFIKQILTALDTNTLDYFKEHLGSFKQYTPEEFEEAFGFEKGTGQEYQSRIDGILEKTNSLKEQYNEFNERMPSPVDFSKLEQGTEEYRKAAIYDAAWKEGRTNYIFFNQTFKDVTSRMKGVTEKYSQILTKNTRGKIPVSDMQVLFEEERMLNEIDILKTEIETLQASTNPLDKKRAEAKRKKLETLRAVSDSMAEQRTYDLDIDSIIKSQVQEFKAELQAQNIEAPSDQEIEDLIRERFKEEGIIESFAQNKVQAGQKYEKSVRNYLKSLAEINDDIIFDSDLDGAFEALKDYNKLDVEAKAMAKAINMLHNPTDFYTHVERNYKWMSDLYTNRKQYYDQMVNQTLDDIELNAILNALAAQNVYISADDLIAFKTQFKLPEEFYDATRKMVIRPTSPDYEFYVQAFVNVIRTKQEEKEEPGKTESQVADQQLQDILDALTKEEREKIDALPKERVREGDQSLPFGKSKTISIKVVSDNLKSGEYAELTYTTKTGTKTITVYKDGNVLKYDDEDGDEIDLKTVKERFTQAVKYRVAFRANAADAQAIRDEYAEKRADAINAFMEKGAGQAAAVKFTPFTKDTPFEEMDEDLQNELRVAFQGYLEANPDIMEELIDVTDDVYQERFESFIRTQPEAIETIERYNKNKQLAIIAGETSIAKAPVFTIAGNKYDFGVMSPEEASDALRRMRVRIVELAKKEKDGTIKPIEKEVLALLRLNTPKVEAYLNAVREAQMTPEFQETMRKFQKVLDAQGEISKQNDEYYIVQDKLLKRVTSKINELLNKVYDYRAKGDLLTAYNATLAKATGTEKTDTVQDFLDMFKKMIAGSNYKYHGTSENTFKAIKKEITALAPSERTYDAILGIFIEHTYEAQRTAGTYLDDLIRKFFSTDPNVTIEFDPNKITREAYDTLFGAEGYLTSLKKRVESGEIYVFSDKIRLFDVDAGVTGEPDLIVIDRKTGKVYIIDIKTGDKKKWDEFGNVEDPYNKQVQYALQQQAYANLLYNMTGIEAIYSLLPIEITTDTEENKILTANRPDSLPLGKITLDLVRKDQKGNSIKDLVETIIPRVAPQIKVATELNPELRTQLNRMGYTDTVINGLSKDEIERIIKEGIVSEDYVPAEGVSQEEEEVKKQRSIDAQARLRNIQAIQRKIEVLDQKRNLIKEDASKIKDTLDFLDKILELSTESAGVEVDAIMNRVNNLEDIANTLFKSKARKRGEKTQLRADELKAQLRKEFSVANDVLNRVKQLRHELEQLEAISKDLGDQMSYYRNLLQDKNFTNFTQEELRDKADKIKAKIGTIEKLIKAIKNAISKSLAYLKEYLSIWKGVYAETKAFKEETGFRELSQQELADLIKSTSEADKATLDSYAGLKKQYSTILDRLNTAMDDVDFIDEVREKEETRLEQLINKLQTYDNQLRYITELFDEVSDDIFMEPNLSDNNAPNAPKPTNVAGTASSVRKIAIEAGVELNEAESEVISEFFPEGGIPSAPESKLLTDYLMRIQGAKSIDDINVINASISKFGYKLTVDEVRKISQAIRSRLEVLKSDPTAVPVTQNNIKKGDQLIVKNAIFINKESFASQSDTLQVTQVEKDGVRVTNLITKKSEKLTFEDINKNTMLKDLAEKVTVTPPVEITDEEKTNIKNSNDITNSFIQDPTALAEAEKYADSKSLENLEDELFDTNICE
jgi:hypothetical protein